MAAGRAQNWCWRRLEDLNLALSHREQVLFGPRGLKQSLQRKLETRSLLVKGRPQAESAERRVNVTECQPRCWANSTLTSSHTSDIEAFFSLEYYRRLNRLREKSDALMAEFPTRSCLAPTNASHTAIGAGYQVWNVSVNGGDPHDRLKQSYA